MRQRVHQKSSYCPFLYSIQSHTHDSLPGMHACRYVMSNVMYAKNMSQSSDVLIYWASHWLDISDLFLLWHSGEIVTLEPNEWKCKDFVFICKIFSMIFSAKIIKYLDISRLDTCQVIQQQQKCVYVLFSRYFYSYLCHMPQSHLSSFASYLSLLPTGWWRFPSRFLGPAPMWAEASRIFIVLTCLHSTVSCDKQSRWKHIYTILFCAIHKNISLRRRKYLVRYKSPRIKFGSNVLRVDMATTLVNQVLGRRRG